MSPSLGPPMPSAPATSLGPRAHLNHQAVDQKIARLQEPHVAPLTAFVERLRLAWGGGEAVPWFDPTEAGVAARILVLLEAPGPRATGAGGPRPASAGSGFVSSDNNDQSAANMWQLLREAGIDRGRDLATWNVVPWYVGDGSQIRAITVRDMDEARAALHELMGLLPDLRAVVLLGKKAEKAWYRASPASTLPVISAPHPSPLSLNGRPARRQEILDALVTAAGLARPAT